MQSPPETITRLWTAARAMFERLRAAIGEAATVAARTALTEQERRHIRAWLRPLEAMVRKTVLIEAIALARSGAASPRAAPLRAAAPAARPPAVTLIALPAPVPILPRAASSTARPRAPSLRLWPRMPASAGPRVRDLGAPLVAREAWRDRDRLALARHLAQVRGLRRSEPERLAGRIAALGRVIARPLAAARRLARKLRTAPRLALQLACRRPPRTKLYDNVEITLANIRAFAEARDFQPDSS